MTFAGIGGAFLIGLTSFFSPCILPVIPVFVSTLAGSIGERKKTLKFGRLSLDTQALWRVSAFALGIAVTFAILGLAFGAIGKVFNSPWFLIICSVFVIAFGVYQTGIVTIPFLMREKHIMIEKRNGALGAFLLGFTYAFGWTPCVGLSLGGVLLYVTPLGILTAVLTLLAYSLGFVIPFFIVTAFSDLLLKKIKNVYRYMKAIKIAGGLIIAAMGVYMLVSTLT